MTIPQIIAIWFALSFLAGPVIGRAIKRGWVG
jgi:hypothetical protein